MTNQAAERLRIADSYGVDLASMLTCEGLDPQLPRDLVEVMRAYLAAVQEMQERIDWLLKQDGHSHHQGEVAGLRFALKALGVGGE